MPLYIYFIVLLTIGFQGMKNFRIFVCCLLCLCASANLLAQIRVKPVAGLAQNTVYALSQDEAGFLWIGTGNGIQRFDGHDMKSYKQSSGNKQDGLLGRFVRNGFLHDSKGNIWFSTENGTQYIEPKSGRVKTCYVRIHGQRLALQGTFPLAEDHGRYWLVNESSGIFLYDPLQEKMEQFPVPRVQEQAIPLQIRGVVDGRGDFWFATAKGLFRFSRKWRQWQSYMEGTALSVLACVHDTLWAGAGNKLYYWAIQSGKHGQIPFENNGGNGNITAIHLAMNGTVWIGDDKGNLYSKQKHNRTVVWRTNVNPLFPQGPLLPIYCLYTTRDETLWIGTDVLGLMQVNPNSPVFIISPKNKEQRKSYFVQSILAQTPNQILLGLYQNGVVSFNSGNGLMHQFGEKCSSRGLNKNTMVLHHDSLQRTWIFHCGVLEITQNKQRYRVLLNPPEGVLSTPGSITAFCLKPYKDVWLLGTSIGLYVISFNGGNYQARHLSQWGYTAIIDLWVNPLNQEIWLGLETGGISIAKSLLPSVKPKSLLGQERNSIKQFCYWPKEANYLWVASLNGLLLIHLPSGKQFVYHETHGLNNSYLSGLARTENYIWVSTGNAGIARANVVNRKKNELFPKLEFENFTSDDGLPTNEFNSGACCYTHGSLFMGSSAGLVQVIESPELVATPTPAIRFSGLLVNGKPYSDSLMPEWINSMSLQGKQQSIYLKFTGIGYRHAEKFQYRYCLKGWDADWVYSGHSCEVRYGNLSPGEYTFLASVRALGGEWSEPISLPITIKPPFWMKPWFIVLVSIGVLALFYGVVRYISRRRLLARLAVLEQKQQLALERTRISREMHDDIGAGLTQITLMSEALAHQVKDAKANEIAEVSRRLVHNMSEIVWSLHAESSSLQELFAYLREQLSDFLDKQPIHYRLDFPDTLSNPILDFRQKRNIMLLVKEAVHNAVKHSGASLLEVIVHAETDQLKVCVKDNGKGFDIASRHTGNGLRNMQARAEILGGTCTFIASFGQGTQVIMTIPIAGLLPKSP